MRLSRGWISAARLRDCVRSSIRFGHQTGRFADGGRCDVLARDPATPSALPGVLGKLDRHNGLGISNAGVVDGTEVPWSSIVEIRTQSLVEYLWSGALQK